MVDAPEITNVFAPHRKGTIFTMNRIPTPDQNGHHVFAIPNTDTLCRFSYNQPSVTLQHGFAYQITGCKQVFTTRDGKEILIGLVEMARLRDGVVSTDDNDKIIYRGDFDVTGNRVFDEELFISGLTMYFHSVAYEKRFGRPYAGQAELEGKDN